MSTLTIKPINPDLKDEARSALKTALGSTATGIDYDAADNSIEITSDSDLAGDNLKNVQRIREEFMLDPIGEESGIKNMSFDITTGTFSIKSASAQDPSDDRRVYVKMPSANRPGEYFTAVLTSAPTTLAASALTGQLFGTKASTAWGEDFPLYIGLANPDDVNGNVKLFITGNWRMFAEDIDNGLVIPSDATKVGKVGALPSDIDRDAVIFFDGDITTTDYHGAKYALLGMVKFQKSSGDVWSAQDIDSMSGAGRFGYGAKFNMVKGGIAGSDTGKWFGANGPDWATVVYTYSPNPYGVARMDFQSSGSRTNGGNSGVMSLYAIGKPEGLGSGVKYGRIDGRVDATLAATDPDLCPVAYMINTINYIRIYDQDAAYVANNDFTGTSDDLQLAWDMPIFA